MQKTIVMQVCDIDGEREATEFITWRGPNGGRVSALCTAHFKQLLDRSTAPRPGRRPGTKVATKSTSRKRVTRKRVARSRSKKR